MFYLKSELSNGITINVPVTDDIYAECPDCLNDHHIDFELFMAIMSDGDLHTTKVKCANCSIVSRP